MGKEVNQKNRNSRLFVVFNEEEQERYKALKIKTNMYKKVKQLVYDFLEKMELKKK